MMSRSPRPSSPTIEVRLSTTSKSHETWSAGDFDVSGFRAKIEKYAPKAVAFNGKKAAQLFFASPNVEYGPQKEKIGPMGLFVLPSTSGAARGFWDSEYWFQIAKFVER
jgi:TDG/mug DNA glycosylase family protein